MADTPPAMTQEEVQREKEVDGAHERMVDSYGAPSTVRGAGRRLTRAKGWWCPACQRLTHDARRVCGFCLAVEPGVLQNVPADGSRGGNGSTPVSSAQPGPGVSQDPGVRILSFPQGRNYRIAVNAPPSSPAKKNPDLGTSVPSGVVLDEEKGLEAEALHMDRAYRQRNPYTHFVSLPIGKLQSVQSSATALLREMKRCCTASSTGVTEEIFTTVPRMHFTLLMLSLPTRDTIASAVERMRILQARLRAWQNAGGDHGEKGIQPRIRLGGLHVMRKRGRGGGGEEEQKRKAEVLYMGLADAASTAVLMELQQLVHECFSEFIMNDPRAAEESKLLHMTLMNSKWRQDDAASCGQGAQVKQRPRIPFDASCVLQNFAHASLRGGDSDGSIALESLELCALGYDVANECYHCEAVVAL